MTYTKKPTYGHSIINDVFHLHAQQRVLHDAVDAFMHAWSATWSALAPKESPVSSKIGPHILWHRIYGRIVSRIPYYEEIVEVAANGAAVTLRRPILNDRDAAMARVELHLGRMYLEPDSAQVIEDLLVDMHHMMVERLKLLAPSKKG